MASLKFLFHNNYCFHFQNIWIQCRMWRIETPVKQICQYPFLARHCGRYVLIFCTKKWATDHSYYYYTYIVTTTWYTKLSSWNPIQGQFIFLSVQKKGWSWPAKWLSMFHFSTCLYMVTAREGLLRLLEFLKETL